MGVEAVAGLLFWLGASAASEPLWPALSEPLRVGGGDRDAAVVVAIEDYAFVSDVPGAQQNGLDWYAHLTDGRGIPPGRVTLLENHRATKEEIAQALSDARAAVRPGGTLWFVFIGHGAPSADGRDGVLLGMDTQQTATSMYARGVRQSELLSSLSGGPQSETVAIIDACFSGRGATGAVLAEGLQPLIPTEPLSATQTTVLSAGQGDEFAGPLPGLGRPAFSYLVLGALRGWGDEDGDGVVHASEAVRYASGVLRAMPLGRRQTPQLAGPDSPLGHGREPGPGIAQIRRALSTTAASPATAGSLARKPVKPRAAPLGPGVSGRWSGVSVAGEALDIFGPYSLGTGEVWYVDNLDGCVSRLHGAAGGYTEELLYGDCSVWQEITIRADAAELHLTADGEDFRADFMGAASVEPSGSWTGTIERVKTQERSRRVLSGLLVLGVQISFKGERPTLYWPVSECASRLDEQTSGKGWAQYRETRLSGMCPTARRVQIFTLSDDRLLLSYDGFNGTYVGIFRRE